MTEVLAYISGLTQDYPGISEVWLFGSRSNGTARPDSDWDLFAFANHEIFDELQRDPSRRRSDIDLLVVLDGNEFRGPWDNNPKRGWLTEWEWKKLSAAEASYTTTSRNSAGGEWSQPLQLLKASRIWPTQR